MSAGLAPGDLAWLVRGHCDESTRRVAGHILRVGRIERAGPRDRFYCHTCGAAFKIPSNERIAHPQGSGRNQWVPCAWLRKIPPLTDDERRGDLAEFELDRRRPVPGNVEMIRQLEMQIADHYRRNREEHENGHH